MRGRLEKRKLWARKRVRKDRGRGRGRERERERERDLQIKASYISGPVELSALSKAQYKPIIMTT